MQSIPGEVDLDLLFKSKRRRRGPFERDGSLFTQMTGPRLTEPLSSTLLRGLHWPATNQNLWSKSHSCFLKKTCLETTAFTLHSWRLLVHGKGGLAGIYTKAEWRLGKKTVALPFDSKNLGLWLSITVVRHNHNGPHLGTFLYIRSLRNTMCKTDQSFGFSED